jgi:hypothetical protein
MCGAGVREGVLWLIDARGQPFVLPVSHAGLRARALALAGAPILARSIAEQGAKTVLRIACSCACACTALPRDTIALLARYVWSAAPSPTWAANGRYERHCMRLEGNQTGVQMCSRRLPREAKKGL